MGQTVRFEVANTTINKSIPFVTTSNGDLPYASNATAVGTFQPTSDQVRVVVKYPEVSAQSEGWLDYIEVNIRRHLKMSGSAMAFRDVKTLDQSSAIFRISDAGGNIKIWDITNPQIPLIQQTSLNGNKLEFGANTLGILRNFIAVTDGAAFPKPETSAGRIGNQNLHGIQDLDLVIVFHPEFEASAQRLAEHRRTNSGLDVKAVNVNEVFNEFSSGGKEPTAIRDFARMLLERNPDKFEYLILFGDGSSTEK